MLLSSILLAGGLTLAQLVTPGLSAGTGSGYSDYQPRQDLAQQDAGSYLAPRRQMPSDGLLIPPDGYRQDGGLLYRCPPSSLLFERTC
jgi:hypothetical protein